MQHKLKKQSHSGMALKTMALGFAALFIARKIYKSATKTDLKGKVVLITGGSRGLGLAIAMELAKRNARLVLTARSPKHLAKAKQLLEERGSEVFTIQADMTSETEVSEMIQKAIQHFGRIDVLINNAGIMIVGPGNVMEIKDYKDIMEANFWSALHTVQSVLPYFKERGGGHIVNICSIGGKIAVPHMLPYSVSKFAMIGLSQGLSAELAKENVIVTTVIPNLMRTGSPRNITVKGNHRAEYAWFKIADSVPFLSQSASNASKRIVESIENRETEVTLTFTAKVATLLQATVPTMVGVFMRVINKLLPKSIDSSMQKGYESESGASNNLITKNTDRAAVEFNQY